MVSIDIHTGKGRVENLQAGKDTPDRGLTQLASNGVLRYADFLHNL